VQRLPHRTAVVKIIAPEQALYQTTAFNNSTSVVVLNGSGKNFAGRSRPLINQITNPSFSAIPDEVA